MSTQNYTVEGMTCGHCEMSVREEVSEITGVTSVNADHKTGQVTVEGDNYTREDINAAVTEAGYTLV